VREGLYEDEKASSAEAFRYKSTVTLVQALTVSHNRALPYWYRRWEYQHSRILPHWYRYWQYHTTELCHIRIGTNSITQQSSATLEQVLILSHNKALSH